MKTLVFVSHNAAKVAEISAVLRPLGIQVLSATEVGIGDIEETGSTFAENAIIKAEEGFKQCGLPCLGDDSGICINALNGAPGVYSKRWAFALGHQQFHERVLAELADVPTAQRGASVTCSLAFAQKNQSVQVFSYTSYGSITRQPQGAHGFGYDNIYLPEGSHKTYAEMLPAEKNHCSERAYALKRFIEYIQTNAY